jgi:hypothetical protein
MENVVKRNPSPSAEDIAPEPEAAEEVAEKAREDAGIQAYGNAEDPDGDNGDGEMPQEPNAEAITARDSKINDNQATSA